MSDPRAPLPRSALASDLRYRVFGMRRRASRPPAVGVEVELLALSADTRAPAPIESAGPDDPPATLPVLRRLAEAEGWTEELASSGAPSFRLPGGGLLSYEPGGQVELSTPPCGSATLALQALRSVIFPLRQAMADSGIELLSVGVDPCNPLMPGVPQIRGERYVALTNFLEAQGTGGVRMMRQTAALQVNLDWGSDPIPRWRVLNAAAPYLVAAFANSPVYLGEDAGHSSMRARIWRELDGGRTGMFAGGEHSVSEYLEFALAAPFIFRRTPEAGYATFAEWNAVGAVDDSDWRVHLTTLFPEIRPKGYVEIRSCDVVPPEWYAAPLAVMAGITYHAPSLAAAADLLRDPQPDLLDVAAHSGLGDAMLASGARDLFEIGLRGAAALGPEFLAHEDLEEARAFFDRFTRRGRTLADETLESGSWCRSDSACLSRTA